MEIYQLRTLLAVARHGHLTRASEQLHLTQSAVSKQLKALEDELGVTLFDRTPTGMVATKACSLLLPHVERTLGVATVLLSTAKQLRGEVGGIFKIGTIIDPDSLRLGPTLWKMMRAHPLIDVKLHHGISGWVMERVLAGELDAGYYLGPVTDGRLDFLELTQVNYRIIAPAAWEAQLNGASWEALAALPWVGTPMHSSQHRIVKHMFAEHQLVPNYAVEADQEASMLSLVISGAALCIMREELALAALSRGDVHVLPDCRQPCMLSLIYDRTRHADGMVAALCQILKEEWEVKPE